MNRREIWTWYTMEIRSALRDRSVVVTSILLPVFLYPVILWVMFSAFIFVEGVNEGFTSRIALMGAPPVAHTALVAAIEAEENVELRRDLGEDEAVAQVEAGNLDAIVTFVPAGADGAALRDNFGVAVRYDRSETRSSLAVERVEGIVDEYRTEWLSREADVIGLSDADRALFIVGQENVSPSEEFGTVLVGMMAPVFLVLMVVMGSLNPAVDTIAGERERSTWETTITTSASRMGVVTAKYLYVATMGVLAGGLNVVAIFVSVGPILRSTLGASSSGAEFTFRVPPLAVPIMLVGAIGLALMVAAALMILASFARTFKDGQAMAQPVMLVFMLITFFFMGTQTDRTLTAGIAAIPVGNVIVMMQDAITGVFLWPYILEAVVVNLILVVFCLRIARSILRVESLLIGSGDGGFWRFAQGSKIIGRVLGRSQRYG